MKDNRRVFWLELGNQFSGFEHILYDRNIFGTFEFDTSGHLFHFAKWGGYYTQKEIATLILNTINNEEYISRVDEEGREQLIFRIETKKETIKYLVIVVGSNGYIITAHPFSDKKGNELFGIN